MMAFSTTTALLAALWMGSRVQAVNNGLALTPQMGWVFPFLLLPLPLHLLLVSDTNPSRTTGMLLAAA
jgi:hypothetical protein